MRLNIENACDLWIAQNFLDLYEYEIAAKRQAWNAALAHAAQVCMDNVRDAKRPDWSLDYNKGVTDCALAIEKERG